MRHEKAGVRLALARADQRGLGADRGPLGGPLRPLFKPAVRALLAAIAATALTSAPADAKTTSTHAKTTSTPFWTTQHVEGGVASLIAERTPFFTKNVRVDSVRCLTAGSRRWFCIIRVRKNGHLDPEKYLYTVSIDRGTGVLNARAIN